MVLSPFTSKNGVIGSNFSLISVGLKAISLFF